jgi:hypothetical protein
MHQMPKKNLCLKQLNPKYFAFERKRERFRWGDDTAKRFQ